MIRHSLFTGLITGATMAMIYAVPYLLDLILGDSRMEALLYLLRIGMASQGSKADGQIRVI